jgi:hypothetical protein
MRYGFFRLRSLEVDNGNVIPDGVIWQAIPAGSGAFWPALMLGRESFEKKIENFYPVSVTLKPIGWGRYKVELAPREVFLSVSWNSQLWWLSADGYMWRADLPSMLSVNGMSRPNRPMLSWDAKLPLPIDSEKFMGDIYPSSLPITKIKRWYDTIDRISWRDDVYCLMAKKIEGRQVVQVLLGTEKSITGELILKDDASDWLSLAAALKNIYPASSGRVPPGLVINATYTDMKFTVSDRRHM